MTSGKHVVIIGAGIGGLATAALLAKDGYTVEIYESAHQTGGRAGQDKVAGFTFDTGPSWYLMPRVFERTFKLLGTSVERELDLIKLSPAYKVFFERHSPLTITGDQATDMATFESIEPGAGNALRRYITEGNEIYELSLRHFLYTNFTKLGSFLRKDILRHGPRMLRLALTPVHRHVQRYVHDQRLQQILEYPMVFLGSSPFSAPGIYSLMSALDFKEGVYYPRGGLYAIIESLTRLCKENGVTIHLNQPVASITAAQGVATGIKLGNGREIAADIVLSNADLHYTETTLLPAEARSYSDSYWKKRDTGISGLLLYLGIKGSLPEFEHHNLLFVEQWKENFEAIYTNRTIPKAASMYVSKTSASDNTAPDGHENVFVLVPLPTGITIDEAKLNELADNYLQQLEDATGVSNLRERIVYQRLFGPDDFSKQFNAFEGTALGLSHELGQSALFRTSNKSKKLSNLFYVGANTLPGVGLPMCLISAELAYERIAGRKPQEDA